MRELFLLLFLLTTAFQAAVLGREFQRSQKISETREDLRRLSKLTLEFFRGKEPPRGKEFWTAIGRQNGEPIFDPWGQEYRLDVFEGETHREYLWVSAGPDRTFGNSDDLKVRVPLPRENPDLTRPGITPDSGPTSIDAK